MISNSYFPAIAAIELGFFKEQGLDVSLEMIFPVDKAYAALRDGTVDFVGGSAHSALAAFPQWQGVKLLCAQAQGMYWFLVMHKDLGGRRGEIGVVKGKSIAAAPWVEMGLRRQFRGDRGKGAGGTQDRRFLGQRHGCRGGGAARGRHHCARRAARRRA